jgi:hypothetical protein
MLIAAILGMLALVPTAEAQSQSQYGQITCTGVTTGTPATSTVVQRAVAVTPPATPTWTTISPVIPMTGTPGVSAPYTDMSRVSGTAYQYRCLQTNAGGSTPTDASASLIRRRGGRAGVGAVGVVIIAAASGCGPEAAQRRPRSVICTHTRCRSGHPLRTAVAAIEAAVSVVCSDRELAAAEHGVRFLVPTRPSTFDEIAAVLVLVVVVAV